MIFYLLKHLVYVNRLQFDRKILIILFIFSTFAFSNSLGLSSQDIVILKKIKSVTNDKMMKYTLMALAIKESSVGKNQINLVTKNIMPFYGQMRLLKQRH